jgi:broad specificity phosphatase PhoE
VPNQYGMADPPLTKLGRVQARRVAKRLSGERFAAIYCSDLARAHETARAIKVHHPGTRLVVDRGLREIPGYGAGEVRQAARACRAILRRARPGDHVLVVAHGNLIRFFAARAAGVDPGDAVFFDTCNSSVTVLRVNKRRTRADYYRLARIALANCAGHLLPRQITNC